MVHNSQAHRTDTDSRKICMYFKGGLVFGRWCACPWQPDTFTWLEKDRERESLAATANNILQLVTWNLFHSLDMYASFIQSLHSFVELAHSFIKPFTSLYFVIFYLREICFIASYEHLRLSWVINSGKFKNALNDLLIYSCIIKCQTQWCTIFPRISFIFMVSALSFFSLEFCEWFCLQEFFP